jgi:hypothetical protein
MTCFMILDELFSVVDQGDPRGDKEEGQMILGKNEGIQE